MPGWNTHLEAGIRLNQKLKFSGIKRKKFLLGCLLPDINNNYINNVKNPKPHGLTYYAFDQKSSLNFYAENKAKINQKDPIYLGYLLHLYADGYFNYNFYHSIKRSPIGKNLTPEEKLKIKHNDFWIYDLFYSHKLDLDDPEETKILSKAANRITTVKVNPEELEEVDKILTERNYGKLVKDKKYLFFDKAKLDQLLDSMIESFSNDYLGGKNA